MRPCYLGLRLDTIVLASGNPRDGQRCFLLLDPRRKVGGVEIFDSLGCEQGTSSGKHLERPLSTICCLECAPYSTTYCRLQSEEDLQYRDDDPSKCTLMGKV
jgi:hypothetical protein